MTILHNKEKTMTKIIMHGCNGKMGKVISNLVAQDTTATIVAGIDPTLETNFDYPVFSSIKACDIKADVIIDFSIADAVDTMLDDAKDKKLPVVLCTTGLTQMQIAKVHETATSIPVLFSANMSLGVNLLVNLVQKATSVLTNANFDIEIIEKHHNQKVDAPSGTALYIADAINETLHHTYDYTYDRSTTHEKRSKKEIGIHAVRGGSIVGEHSVIFAGQDETVEIHHYAHSKNIFAIGAINAAKFISNQPIGMYNMGDVIQ